MFLSAKCFRSAAFSSYISALACLSACSSDAAKNDQNPLSSDIVREGSTTSAALNEFLATAPDDWPWAGGEFTSPMDQAALQGGTPQAFAWKADSTAAPDPMDTLSPTKQQGQAFLIVFSSKDDAKLLRVFTNLTLYTPDPAAWQKLVSAGEPITLSITSATFENDKLTADGGPHTGQTISFTIQ